MTSSTGSPPKSGGGPTKAIQLPLAQAPVPNARTSPQVTVGWRNRAFKAPQLIDAFTSLERQLASPEGDTLVSEPVRRVPRRRR